MQLQEIKKGCTGTGLLIENDGYISIDSDNNKVLKESVDNFMSGAIKELPRPFVVSAVFQKYDIENANGRIYPKNILQREVEKYVQIIKDRRGYGECYKGSAMVLTECGWKSIKEVKEGEYVLTLNPSSNKIELQPIIRTISRNHSGTMYHLKGNNIDECVTPKHEYPIYDRNHKFRKFISAEEIFKSNSELAHFYIPKNGEWEGRNDEFFTIPSLSEEQLNKITNRKLKEKYSNPLIIPMDIFAKFMGIYLSEGSHGKNGNYSVNIHQKKDEVTEEIQKMLEDWGIKYGMTNKGKKNIRHTFSIQDMRLHEYVKQFGLCYTKYVPYILKQQNKDILKIFYEWFVMGDGRVRGDKRDKNSSFSTDAFSTSKQLVLDINEIQLKIGFSGTMHEEDRTNDRFIEGRLIEGKNCQNMFFTYKSLTKGVYLDKRFLEITEEEYNGDVYCIEVPNHIWYVMENGKCHWTKNCNHPTESTIDVERICMVITELHWVGHTLVGKMELPITEGFRRFGIVSCLADLVAHWIISGLKIGVSSRGLGTVSQIGGKLVVNDDYEIVCWDVVSQPSTPNAFIEMEEVDLKPYIQEQVIEKQGVVLNEDRFSKFDSWLNG